MYHQLNLIDKEVDSKRVIFMKRTNIHREYNLKAESDEELLYSNFKNELPIHKLN